MNLDASGTKQDALPQDEGQPFVEQDREPSDTEVVEIFTKDDVERLVADRHSTLDKEIASNRKEINALKREAERAENAEAQLESYRRKEEDEEYQRVKSNPSELKVFQKRQELRGREDALKEKEKQVEQLKAEHQELIDAGYRVKTVEAAEGIAKEYGVSATDLLDLAPQTPEQMKAFAKKLKAIEAKGTPALKLDSGVGVGAGVADCCATIT